MVSMGQNIKSVIYQATHFELNLVSGREPLKCCKQESAIIRFPFRGNILVKSIEQILLR